MDDITHPQMIGLWLSQRSSRWPQHLSISTAKAWQETEVKGGMCPKRHNIEIRLLEFLCISLLLYLIDLAKDYDDHGVYASPTWVGQEGQKNWSVWGVSNVFHCTFLVGFLGIGPRVPDETVKYNVIAFLWNKTNKKLSTLERQSNNNHWNRKARIAIRHLLATLMLTYTLTLSRFPKLCQ